MRCSASITTLVLRGSSEAIGSSARMIFGLLHQRPGDGDALLLAAREACRRAGRRAGRCRAVRAPTSAIALSSSLHSRNTARSVETLVQPADQHVGEHVEPADQIELLEDHRAAGAPVAQGRAPERVTSRPPYRMRPGSRSSQPIDHAQQRRFAGAGPTDDADELPPDLSDNAINGLPSRHSGASSW